MQKIRFSINLSKGLNVTLAFFSNSLWEYQYEAMKSDHWEGPLVSDDII